MYKSDNTTPRKEPSRLPIAPGINCSFLPRAFKTPPGLAPDHLSNFISRYSLLCSPCEHTFFLYLENAKLAPISGLLHLLFLLSAIFFPYSRLDPSIYSDFSSSIATPESPLFSYLHKLPSFSLLDLFPSEHFLFSEMLSRIYFPIPSARV